MATELSETRPARDVAIAVVAGVGRLAPGLGAVIDGIQAGMAAKERLILEEVLAHTSARITLLERERAGFKFDPTDPEFIAATFRIVRAAQESADEDKRKMLAGALANCGSWSELPFVKQERATRALIELTAWEVRILALLYDGRKYYKLLNGNSRVAIGSYTLTLPHFIRQLLSPTREIEEKDVKEIILHLQAELLVRRFEPTVSLDRNSNSLFARRTSAFGSDVVRLADPDSAFFGGTESAAST